MSVFTILTPEIIENSFAKTLLAKHCFPGTKDIFFSVLLLFFFVVAVWLVGFFFQ